MDTALYILRWLAALALLLMMLGLWTSMLLHRFPFWRGAGLVLLLQAAMLVAAPPHWRAG